MSYRSEDNNAIRDTYTSKYCLTDWGTWDVYKFGGNYNYRDIEGGYV